MILYTSVHCLFHLKNLTNRALLLNNFWYVNIFLISSNLFNSIASLQRELTMRQGSFWSIVLRIILRTITSRNCYRGLPLIAGTFTVKECLQYYCKRQSLSDRAQQKTKTPLLQFNTKISTKKFSRCSCVIKQSHMLLNKLKTLTLITIIHDAFFNKPSNHELLCWSRDENVGVATL